MDNLDFRNVPEDLSIVDYMVLYHISNDKEIILDVMEEEDTDLKVIIYRLQDRLYIKLEEGNIELRKKTLDLFPENKVEDFATFWHSYHEITGLRPTDKAPAEVYWRRLKPKEKKRAIDNIEGYYSSLNDKRFCKKARTYLKDKNFDDDFSPTNNSIGTINEMV